MTPAQIIKALEAGEIPAEAIEWIRLIDEVNTTAVSSEDKRGESAVQKDIWQDTFSHGMTLWRNNVGTAWQGKPAGGNAKQGTAIGDMIKRGAKILLNARRVHFGLTEGSGDLIGFQKITITADMVGKEIPVFASVEVKGPRTPVKAKQKAWAAFIRKAGGVAIIARSVDEFRKGVSRAP